MKNWVRFAIVLLILFMLSGCAVYTGAVPAPSVQPSPAASAGQEDMPSLRVHFVDVGQGDCMVLESGGEVWIVDAGPNAQEQRVVDYLKGMGVKKLSGVIGTHPHEDHIGGLDAVIRAFDVEKVIMPKLSHNTKTFEDVLDAIEEKNLRVTTPKVGAEFPLGTATLTLLGPGEPPYADANDASIVARVTLGEVGVVLTGDAEVASEKRVIQTGLSLEADILKVGHHGSTTSTSKEFLAAISPSIAVITLGKDNTYGHPHQPILDRLEKAGVEILRTDQLGTIVIQTDGKQISWKAGDATGEITGDPVPQKQALVGNKNSRVFHLPSCNSLPAQENRVEFNTREEALDAGYTPHKQCNP